MSLTLAIATSNFPQEHYKRINTKLLFDWLDKSINMDILDHENNRLVCGETIIPVPYNNHVFFSPQAEPPLYFVVFRNGGTTHDLRAKLTGGASIVKVDLDSSEETKSAFMNGQEILLGRNQDAQPENKLSFTNGLWNENTSYFLAEDHVLLSIKDENLVIKNKSENGTFIMPVSAPEVLKLGVDGEASLSTDSDFVVAVGPGCLYLKHKANSGEIMIYNSEGMVLETLKYKA